MNVTARERSNENQNMACLHRGDLVFGFIVGSDYYLLVILCSTMYYYLVPGM